VIIRDKKAHKHFSDRDILFSVLDEMKGRFGFSYSELADRMCREIRAYYEVR
jgi:hypothetical protein